MFNNRFIQPRYLVLALVIFIGCEQQDFKTIIFRDSTENMYEEGIQLWSEHNYEEAIQSFIALTKASEAEHPLIDDALFLTARIFHHYLFEPEQAARYYRYLTKKHENSPFYRKAMRNLGFIYFNEGNEGKKRALLLYEKLQKVTPQGEEWAINQYYMAKLYLEMKNYEEMRIALKDLIQKSPNSSLVAKSYHLIGFSYYLQGKKHLAKIAYEETDRRFNYSKDSFDAALSLSNIYIENGELNLSVQNYNNLIGRMHEDDPLYPLFKEQIEVLEERSRENQN